MAAMREAEGLAATPNQKGKVKSQKDDVLEVLASPAPVVADPSFGVVDPSLVKRAVTDRRT